MKHLHFLSASLLLLISSLYSQSRLPDIDLHAPGVPQWVQLMYTPQPNAWEIDRLFAEEHPDITRGEREEEEEEMEHESGSVYEFIYKQWRHTVQDWIDENGMVHYPTTAELDQEEVFRQSLRQDGEQRGGPLWTLAGPWINYRARYNLSDSVPAVSWHSNIYSITRCQSNPNILYCGSEAGGVYKSTDHGATWAFVSKNEYVRDVKAIEVHPANPDIALYGARGKVYRTTDGGITWATCGQAAFQSLGLYVWDLHFNPSNPNMIYAATDGGLYRTTDMGNNWTQILTEECISVVTKPGNDAIVYTIQHNATTDVGDFYKSSDSGATFTIKPTGWFTVPVADAGLINSKGGRIAVTEADPNRVYCLLVGESQAAATLQLHGFIGIYVSTDAGETWSNPHVTIGAPYNGTTHPNPMTFSGDNNTYNQIYYNTTITASQLNADEFIFGGLSLWRSTDAAATYTPVGGYVGNIPYIHPDMQELKTFKTGPSTQETWLACDGGINLSTDFFATHRARNYGIGAGDFWGFDQGWNEDILVGGRYHNGNAAYYEAYTPGEFLSLGGGEASTGYVNYSNERKTLYSDIGGEVLPVTITGIPGSFGLSLSPNEGYWLNESSRILFDDRYWNKAYMGYQNRVYQSNDGGTSFGVLDTFGTAANSKVYWIEQCKMQPDVIYAQVLFNNYSRIYKSTDSGDNWAQITIPQTNKRYLFFTVSATNPDELWVAYTNGSNGNKVYHTTSSGSSWNNITSSLLDNQEIYQVVHQAGTDGGVYVAVKEGAVYYRNNSMSNWAAYSSGLPVAIEPLRMVPFYKENKIRLCTKGHSIWEAPLYEPSVLIADFSADYKAFYCPGDTVHFADHSVCTAAATYQWTFTGGIPSASTLKYPKVVYATSGSYDVTLIVHDGAAADTITRTLFISSAGSSSSFVQEGFESGVFAPAGWKLVDAANDFATWHLRTDAGGYGLSTNCMYFDNYYYDAQGRRDAVWTSKYDFTQVASAWLKFDLAYAPFGSGYEDSLAVNISDDCGASFTTVYLKGRLDLASAPDYTSGLYLPVAADWRTDSVNISAFAGAAELIISFENRGHYGQGINIDNINIAHVVSSAGVDEQPVILQPGLYPNPSRGQAWLSWNAPENGKARIIITDAMGREVFVQQVTVQKGMMSIPLLLQAASGTYLVKLDDGKHASTVLRWMITQ